MNGYLKHTFLAHFYSFIYPLTCCINKLLPKYAISEPPVKKKAIGESHVEGS